MKKSYQIPKVSVMSFSREDVITTSGLTSMQKVTKTLTETYSVESNNILEVTW